VLIGDSFAHGACVPPSQSIAGRLREHYRVLNLGIGGSGPLTHLAIMREYVAKLRPRHIVWNFHANDLADLAGEIASALTNEPASEPPDRGGIERQMVEAFRLTNLRVAVGLDFGGRNTDWQVLKQTFAAGKQAAADIGASFHLVYLAAPEEVLPIRLGRASYGRWRTLAIIRELGIDVIDTLPALSRLPDPRAAWPEPGFGRYLGMGHMTETGYAVAAEEIRRAIRGP
jgi:hypothetical protein